jgi:hypothetical protein
VAHTLLQEPKIIHASWLDESQTLMICGSLNRNGALGCRPLDGTVESWNSNRNVPSPFILHASHTERSSRIFHLTVIISRLAEENHLDSTSIITVTECGFHRERAILEVILAQRLS